MGRGHTPFGYRIENGKAAIHEKEAGQVRETYRSYLSGLSYTEAAKRAGLEMPHSSVKRMLQNRHYPGDGFYPAIIDRDTFDAAEKERLRRSKALGRDNRKRQETGNAVIPVRFRMGTCTAKKKDPYEQAAYIYSLIESEV